MRKTILLFLLVLLVADCGYAQRRGRQRGHSSGQKGYFGISVGPSLPMGKFAATDSEDNMGGAKLGLQLNLVNFAYLFT